MKPKYCTHSSTNPQQQYTQQCKNTALGYILAISGHITNVCLSVYNIQLKQLMLYTEKRGIDFYGEVFNKYYENPKNFRTQDMKEELKKYNDRTNETRQVIKGFDKRYDKKIKGIYQTSRNLFTLYLGRFEAFHKGYKGFYAIKNELRNKIIDTYNIKLQNDQNGQKISQIRQNLAHDYDHFQKFIIKGSQVPNQLRQSKDDILAIRDYVLEQLQEKKELPECLDRFGLRQQGKEKQLTHEMSEKIIKRIWALEQPGEEMKKISKKIQEGIQRYNTTIGMEESYSRLLSYLEAFQEGQPQ